MVAERPPIPMARVEEVAIPGPAGEIAARLYVPASDGSDPPPLLVYFHGGGWVIGDLETHDSPCRFLAANAGVQVLAVDYRLAPEHPFPAAAEDAFAAFSWASDNAGRFGIKPGRIAVGGDSAGANLAAVAALTARGEGGPAPAMQLLIYPVTETGRELASRRTLGEGFLLTRRDMAYYEDRYLPPGPTAATPGSRSSRPPTSAVCRPPTSPSPASTRCATRASPTPSGCARQGSRWPSVSIPASSTPSST